MGGVFVLCCVVGTLVTVDSVDGSTASQPWRDSICMYLHLTNWVMLQVSSLLLLSLVCTCTCSPLKKCSETAAAEAGHAATGTATAGAVSQGPIPKKKKKALVAAHRCDHCC